MGCNCCKPDTIPTDRNYNCPAHYYRTGVNVPISSEGRMIDQHDTSEEIKIPEIKLDTMTSINYESGTFYGVLKKNSTYKGCFLINNHSGKYTGYWKNDAPNGKGILEFDKEHFYRGNFKNGKFHRYGEYKNLNVLYKGEWRNDKKHGYGVLKVDSIVYEGRFKNDLLHGEGALKVKNGVIYGKFERNELKSGRFASENKAVSHEICEHERIANMVKIFIKEGVSLIFRSPRFGEIGKVQLDYDGILVNGKIVFEDSNTYFCVNNCE